MKYDGVTLGEAQSFTRLLRPASSQNDKLIIGVYTRLSVHEGAWVWVEKGAYRMIVK